MHYRQMSYFRQGRHICAFLLHSYCFLLLIEGSDGFWFGLSFIFRCFSTFPRSKVRAKNLPEKKPETNLPYTAAKTFILV